MIQRYEKGVRSSMTPRHDIPERMYQEWNDGNLEAVKQHFDNPMQEEKRCDRYHRGGGIGAFGSDQDAYFKMWEQISGIKMDKEGYLTRQGIDYSRLDSMLRGRESQNLPSFKSLQQNMDRAMLFCQDDEDIFLEIYTPFICFTSEPRISYKLWLKGHGIDSLDSHNLCATFGYDGHRVHIYTLFIRTDYLRKFVSTGTIRQMHETYEQFKYYKSI